ncbi:MAG: deoxynucleotide monophosphate kinase [Pseudomonadota bacterium]
MKLKALGLSGRGGAGKTTTARALMAADNRFVNLPISAPIKAMMRELYRALGVDDETIKRKLDGNLKREPCPYLNPNLSITPTAAMQTLGTEWGRMMIDEDLWARAWAAMVAALPDGSVAINDSIRFPNEADAVRALGGTIVRIEGRGDLSAEHVSERSAPEPDYVINNAGMSSEWTASVVLDWCKEVGN